MRPTQVLPAGYHSIGTLDVAHDQRLLIILNIAGLFCLALGGWLFFRAAFWLRPQDAASGLGTLSVSTLAGWAALVAAILALTAMHIILHEAVHGIFFWIFTRARPRFAFRWAYAYAAAPGWYIPRNPFFVTTLAPLVVLSLAGLLVMAAAPAAWILPTWFVITMNAGGAVGDLAVAAWLARQPPGCLVQDRGDAVTFFLPSNDYQIY